MKNCQFNRRIRPFGNKYQHGRTPHVEFSISAPRPRKKSKDPNKKIFRPPPLPVVGFGLWEKYQSIVQPDSHNRYDLVFTIDTKRPHRSGKKKKKKPDQIQLLAIDIRLSAPK